MSEFLSSYIQYTSGGECPIVFRRWSAITGIAALLERNIHVPHGHSEIYPNMYCMLLGNSGSRKSTAIKVMKQLMVDVGYSTMSAEKTSKEKFLADLSGSESEDILDKNIFGDSAHEISPMFIPADEANDFFGINNMEFLSLLGSLWDWNGKYENRIKTGKSDYINNPTITILAGNTAQNFSIAFPPAILGQGFFSRLLLIYGEYSGIKIRNPKIPCVKERTEILNMLLAIKSYHYGRISYTAGADSLLDSIYEKQVSISDPRFDSYNTRRLTHLLKLCMIVSAMKLEKTITESSVLEANTYLSYSESLMPKALGEFGKAKSSDSTHKVSELIQNARLPITLQDIWRLMSTEFEAPKDLTAVLQKLLFSGKIQSVSGGSFLPVKAVINEGADYEVMKKFTDYSQFLSIEELNVKP
jgi:hypothetical protein